MNSGYSGVILMDKFTNDLASIHILENGSIGEPSFSFHVLLLWSPLVVPGDYVCFFMSDYRRQGGTTSMCSSR